MGRVGPAERGGAAAAVGGQGTVLYCTVLYCIVLWQGDRSDDEQRAPLPPARVHRRGEAAAPRRGESRRAGVVYHLELET